MVTQPVFVPDSAFCRRFGLAYEHSELGLTILIDASSDVGVLDYIRCRNSGPIGVRRVPSIPGIVQAQVTLSRTGSNAAVAPRINPKAGETVVDCVNHIIAMSISERASDIHFEPAAGELVCRVRVDGVLETRPSLDIGVAAEVVSRIKILAGLDIAERRRPQDGSFQYDVEGSAVDVRVSVIPTDRGEKVVLRLLDRRQLNLSISALGYDAAQQRQLLDTLSVPNGIILITGPTGSGKTTTLYALLNHLKQAQLNISTVEDPIEYKLEGINQTQVRPTINLTFAAMLRALLRQDPNVIMVGEIRDAETIAIAIRAALTGHLVLSTVHTNSAVATITRLVDMGAEPYLLASALRLIVAQRLVRRLCPTCCLPPVASGTGSDSPAARGGDHLTQGCAACRYTGFAGRLAVGEVLVIDSVMREAINRRAGEQEILALSKQHGFRTMSEIAQEFVTLRVTSQQEIMREIGI